MEKNKDTPTKNEKSWEDFVRALPKMEKNMLRENAPLQPKVIFHIIREEGEEEMSRFFRALAFSRYTVLPLFCHYVFHLLHCSGRVRACGGGLL